METSNSMLERSGNSLTPRKAHRLSVDSSRTISYTNNVFLDNRRPSNLLRSQINYTVKECNAILDKQDQIIDMLTTSIKVLRNTMNALQLGVSPKLTSNLQGIYIKVESEQHKKKSWWKRIILKITKRHA